MKIFACAAAAAALLATPAHATLQLALDVGGTPFTCIDNAACDTNPALGILALADQIIGGLTVNGSISASSHAGTQFLNVGSLSIINATATSIAATATVGDTDFAGPVTGVSFSGSGTWQTAGGSTLALAWAADAANTQGAGFAGDLPGTLLDTFSDTAIGPADSFAHSGTSSFVAAGPFSMTESASGVLVAGGELINRGQTMTANVPEASSWAMALMGFAALALIGRRRRQSRFAL